MISGTYVHTYARRDYSAPADAQLLTSLNRFTSFADMRTSSKKACVLCQNQKLAECKQENGFREKTVVPYLKALHWNMAKSAEKLRKLITVTHLLVQCTFSPGGFKPSTNISVKA
jgi:hypothetical protein